MELKLSSKELLLGHGCTVRKHHGLAVGAKTSSRFFLKNTWSFTSQEGGGVQELFQISDFEFHGGKVWCSM